MVLEHVQKNKNLHGDLIFFTRINSKWTIDLNIKCNTTNLLGDSVGENLGDLGYRDDFLGTTPKAGSVRERTVELGWTSLKVNISAL